MQDVTNTKNEMNGEEGAGTRNSDWHFKLSILPTRKALKPLCLIAVYDRK